MITAKKVARYALLLGIIAFLVMKAYKIVKLGGASSIDDWISLGILAIIFCVVGAYGELSMQDCPLRTLITLVVAIFGLALTIHDGMQKQGKAISKRIHQLAAGKDFKDFLPLAAQRAEAIAQATRERQQGEQARRVVIVQELVELLHTQSEEKAQFDRLARIAALRAARGQIDQRLGQMKKILDLCDKLTPAYHQQSKTKVNIEAMVKQRRVWLNRAEKMAGMPLTSVKEGKVYMPQEPLGMLALLRWVVENPMEAPVAPIWKYLCYQLFATICALIAGHLNQHLSESKHANVVSIEQGRNKKSKAA